MLKKLEQQQLELSRQWVEKVVVGMNLCPFAKPILIADSLSYALTQAEELADLETFFLEQLMHITASVEAKIATTLVIFPKALANFYQYLDFVARCEELVEQAGLAEQFQLASFHPNYVFADVQEEDLSHWTNRSPFPMLHIIREAQISRVLANHPNPQSIPERNIEFLRELGKEELVKRFPPFKNYT